MNTKNIFKAVLVISVLISASIFANTPSTVGATTALSSCGTLSIPNETYNLLDSTGHSGSGICLIVAADNITIDLQGHIITGNIIQQLSAGQDGFTMTIKNGTVDGNIDAGGADGTDGIEAGGVSGSAGIDGTSPGEAGGNGTDGTAGGTGGDGSTGGRGGNLTLEKTTVTGEVYVNGGNGGDGGHAGGGNGGDGGRGADIEGTCSSAGHGGNAGHGGQGGQPGTPGNGGSAGTISIIDSSAYNIVSVSNPGQAGSGDGGIGGMGGRGGDSIGQECLGGNGGQGGNGGGDLFNSGINPGESGNPASNWEGGGGGRGGGGAPYSSSGGVGGDGPSISTTDNPPVITINGSPSISIPLGSSYIDQGATAFDEKDGNLSVSSTTNLDTNTLGTYTVVYTATDFGTSFFVDSIQNNLAASSTVYATRTITVSPTQTPATNLQTLQTQLTYRSGTSLPSASGNQIQLPVTQTQIPIQPPIAEVQSSTPTQNTSLSISDLIMPTEISYGQRDTSIKDLQKFLNEKGFLVSRSGAGSPGSETDFFGPLTRNALIRYQKSYGIWQSEFGTLKPITRAFINIIHIGQTK